MVLTNSDGVDEREKREFKGWRSQPITSYTQNPKPLYVSQ